MNYIISLLIGSIIILFFYSKHLNKEINILSENEKLIIDGYETSIKEIEKKQKFDLGIQKEKESIIKAKEKVIIKKEKRGEINEANTNSDFVIVNF